MSLGEQPCMGTLDGIQTIDTALILILCDSRLIPSLLRTLISPSPRHKKSRA